MIYHKMKFAAPCMATWWWHIEPNFIFWKFQLFSLIISIVQVIRAFISITFIAWNIIYFNSITMINSRIKSDALCTPLWWKNYETNFIFQKSEPLSLIISIVQVIRAFISIAFIAWNIIYFNSITMINSKIKSDALCTPLWWKNYEPNFIFQKFGPLSLIISIVLVIFCIAIMIFRPILSLWRVFI